VSASGHTPNRSIGEEVGRRSHTHIARVKIRSIAERHQAGKSLREKCPRSSQGKVILGQGEKRDIVTLIEASNKDRLKNLIPVRHGRMFQSAFAYFRGTAAIQAYERRQT
jgi:hypothetical protein